MKIIFFNNFCLGFHKFCKCSLISFYLSPSSASNSSSFLRPSSFSDLQKSSYKAEELENNAMTMTKQRESKIISIVSSVKTQESFDLTIICQSDKR